MNQPAIENSGMQITPTTNATGMMMPEVAKALGQQQMQVFHAMNNPRDEMKARMEIIADCQNPGLAESALYSYKRGGTLVEGPSIRMAELMVRRWKNLRTGFNVLETRDTESIVQVYAWDLEANISEEKTFTVKHWRDTKNGGYQLTDARDIRELISNQAARMKRECILALIPMDIREDARAEVLKTLVGGSSEPLEVRVKKMLAGFEKIDVSAPMIEQLLGHSIKGITDVELVRLRNVYKGLKDGIAKHADYWPDLEGNAKAAELTQAAQAKKAKREAANPTPFDVIVVEMNAAQSVAALDEILNSPRLDGMGVKEVSDLETIYEQRKKEIESKASHNG